MDLFLHQNWWATGLLAAALTLLGIVWSRAVPKRKRLVFWLFLFPTCATSLIFIWMRQYWVEMLTSGVIGGLLLALWAIFIGYHLPKPNDNNIKVWGQE